MTWPQVKSKGNSPEEIIHLVSSLGGTLKWKITFEIRLLSQLIFNQSVLIWFVATRIALK
jgi:hypothetical protein